MININNYKIINNSRNMNPNYDMKNIFGPSGPQSFNPNPNQPPNEGYPNQG